MFADRRPGLGGGIRNDGKGGEKVMKGGFGTEHKYGWPVVANSELPTFPGPSYFDPEVRERWEREGASWRRMMVVQPPITHLKVVLGSDGDCEFSHSLLNPSYFLFPLRYLGKSGSQMGADDDDWEKLKNTSHETKKVSDSGISRNRFGCRMRFSMSRMTGVRF